LIPHVRRSFRRFGNGSCPPPTLAAIQHCRDELKTERCSRNFDWGEAITSSCSIAASSTFDFTTADSTTNFKPTKSSSKHSKITDSINTDSSNDSCGEAIPLTTNPIGRGEERYRGATGCKTTTLLRGSNINSIANGPHLNSIVDNVHNLVLFADAYWGSSNNTVNTLMFEYDR
jgi:hypothetical protein